MKKTIAFHANQMSIRGTEVALYDYALHNENLLGNASFIIYDAVNKNNQPAAIEKFSKRFELIGYRCKQEIDTILKRKGADLLYAIKAGPKDGLLSSVVPTMVHAVFPTSLSQVHGASFAFISEWLSLHCSNSKVPCVPHIVELPSVQTDLRSELGIPNTAMVLGCHGGEYSFDVPCARKAVQQLLEEDPNIHFVFLNIECFVENPRALFLPGTSDVHYKTRYINSCDAMLHARLLGESFGLSCGEFSIRNKPVITYALSEHTHHHDVLDNTGYYYRDTDSLVAIVRSLDRTAIAARTWDCYTARYNPEAVMDLFDRNLIRPALSNRSNHPNIRFNIVDRLSYLKLNLKMRMTRRAVRKSLQESA
jgi:hypothetical protein